MRQLNICVKWIERAQVCLLVLFGKKVNFVQFNDAFKVRVVSEFTLFKRATRHLLPLQIALYWHCANEEWYNYARRVREEARGIKRKAQKIIARNNGTLSPARRRHDWNF